MQLNGYAHNIPPSTRIFFSGNRFPLATPSSMEDHMSFFESALFGLSWSLEVETWVYVDVLLLEEAIVALVLVSGRGIPECLNRSFLTVGIAALLSDFRPLHSYVSMLWFVIPRSKFVFGLGSGSVSHEIGNASKGVWRGVGNVWQPCDCQHQSFNLQQTLQNTIQVRMNSIRQIQELNKRELENGV